MRGKNKNEKNKYKNPKGQRTERSDGPEREKDLKP